MTRAVQLPLSGALPLNPVELANLLAYERGRLYRELGLDVTQRQAAEEAVRRVRRHKYAEGR